MPSDREYCTTQKEPSGSFFVYSGKESVTGQACAYTQHSLWFQVFQKRLFDHSQIELSPL